ncbi:MAG: glycerophosphodiester phosphodiesterase [bacterium]
MKPYIISHRGASGDTPENTLASFKRAIDQKTDGIELDVHLTKDEIPVVIHDETIDRTTDGSGYIKNFTYEELNKYDAGNYFDEKFKGEKIPALKQVLELSDNLKIINIELKNNKIYYDSLEEKVLKLIEEFDIKDKVIISSFNHYSINKLRSIDKNIELAILYKSWLFEPWLYAERLKINNIHPHYLAVNKEIISKCNNNDIRVNVYGTNERENIKRIIENGADMIICDYPGEVRKQLNNILAN